MLPVLCSTYVLTNPQRCNRNPTLLPELKEDCRTCMAGFNTHNLLCSIHVQNRKVKGANMIAWSSFRLLACMLSHFLGHCINSPTGPSVSRCGTWHADLMATRWSAAQPLKLCKAHKQSTHTYTTTFSKLPLNKDKNGIKRGIRTLSTL